MYFNISFQVMHFKLTDGVVNVLRLQININTNILYFLISIQMAKETKVIQIIRLIHIAFIIIQ